MPFCWKLYWLLLVERKTQTIIYWYRYCPFIRNTNFIVNSLSKNLYTHYVSLCSYHIICLYQPTRARHIHAILCAITLLWIARVFSSSHKIQTYTALRSLMVVDRPPPHGTTITTRRRIQSLHTKSTYRVNAPRRNRNLSEIKYTVRHHFVQSKLGGHIAAVALLYYTYLSDSFTRAVRFAVYSAIQY